MNIAVPPLALVKERRDDLFPLLVDFINWKLVDGGVPPLALLKEGRDNSSPLLEDSLS